jgi:hypothetical protein
MTGGPKKPVSQRMMSAIIITVNNMITVLSACLHVGTHVLLR